MEIPVVFATDENYIVPTYVAACSVLKNTKSKVKIYIMTPGSLSEKDKNILTSLQKEKNCHVTILNMEKRFSDAEMSIPYITFATYYRLLLAQLLDTYQKCVYLDSDLIVNCDIQELYCQDIGTNYLAGVVASEPTFPNFSREQKKQHAEILNVNSLDNYINAGVLVINLEAIRRDKLVDVFLEESKKRYPFQDQDILNSVCYNKIKLLPRKYNVGPMKRNSDSELSQMAKDKATSIISAYESPAIVHYAQPQKPWLSRSFPMASYWWKYYDAIDPKFRKEYLDEFIRKNRKNAIKVRIKHNKVVMGTWKILKNLKRDC